MTSRQQYALVIEYDGADFCGYQYQDNGRTVQGELEKCLKTVLRHSLVTHCAGRTDAGVNATGQIVSFYSENTSIDVSRFLRSMNALLPDSIVARQLLPVPHDFHPRFKCIAREYEYLIWHSDCPSAHYRNKAFYYYGAFPLNEFNAELLEILGHRDFRSFTPTVYRDEVTIRYVDHASFHREEDPLSRSELLVFRIRGNAFLHNMVRILVGTLIDKAKGKLNKTMLEVLEAENRLAAGSTAPAHALYLRKAYYPEVYAASGLAVLPGYPVFRDIEGHANWNGGSPASTTDGSVGLF